MKQNHFAPNHFVPGKRHNRKLSIRSDSLVPVAIIEHAVAKHAGVPVAFLSRPNRHAHLSIFRYMAITLAYEFNTLSVGQVGARFGRSDSLVSTSFATLRDRLETEPRLRATYALIRAELTGQTFIHGDGI